MPDAAPPVLAERPVGNPTARGIPDTFCIRPWNHMRLEASGEARVCCAFMGDNIAHDGAPVSTDRQSLMQIWNADSMRELRRDMVEGRRIAGCETCYLDEASGGVSIRMRDNASWEQGWLNEPKATIDEIKALAADNDYCLPKLPAMIEVETGNLCNLKCRMCNGLVSSRIAKDPVHRQWAEDRSFADEGPDARLAPGRVRRVGAIDGLVDELAKDTGSEVRRLYFLGGEPFLVREIPRLLERLVAAGRARTLSLLFTSNGTVVPEWLSLAAHFQRFDLTISVDGYADDYDYIRYPGRWSKLAHHLQLFKRIPTVDLLVTTTIQINNVLGLTSLFRYLDSIDTGFTGYLLHHPPHLAVSALPGAIRRLAADRLLAYAQDDCRPQHRALIRSFATQLEAGAESGDPDRLRDFMLFTNDLDVSRGQNIHRTDPELVALLERAGFPWLHQTVHAPADHVAQAAPPKSQYEAGATIKLLRGELMHARAKIRLSEENAERVGLELAQVYASRSWRVTRSLRAPGQMLRRWLQGAVRLGRRIGDRDR